MNCKHCNAEMDENAKFCSACGKPVDEPEETVTAAEEIPAVEAAQGPEIQEPKKNTGKIALAVLAVVVILAVLVAVIVKGMGGEKLITGDDTTVAPTSGVVDATEGTVPADGNPDDVTCKGTYTVSDDAVMAAGDTVVAAMGGRELTVSQLQIYYWLEVVNFLQNYGSYASYFGLDYTQPLDTQICTMTENQVTWQQYFLDCALDSWAGYQAMALEAEANGLEMDAEMKEILDGLTASLDEAAVEYGLADAEDLIKSNFSAGATLDSYMAFWETYYNGYTFYNHEYEKIAPTAEEVEAYFTEHETTYAEGGIGKDTRYVDVRHILVMVEGGTTDEEGNTTYSDDEWAACEAEVQAILDEWLAGEATEDTFAALANEKSEDGGSNTNGGLYEDVYEGQMVTAFNDWCFDETRAHGDYGLVKTEYGCHVMFFVAADDNVWYTTAESDLIYELSSALTPAAVEKYPAEIDYSSIMLGNVELS